METLVRRNPKFSLCGLNCCLCPRYNTDGKSKCPGCGGKGFSEQHPTCSVATCNRKHGNVEYCFQCSDYPCKKYELDSKCDSFISYKSVKQNFSDAKININKYMDVLERRYEILQVLISEYNDSKSKGLYCLVSNDMPIDELEELFTKAKNINKEMTIKEKAKKVKEEIESIETRLRVKFKLRKNA